MAYEYLQKLFGEPKEGEQPKAMTFSELEQALNAAPDVQLANLKEGGYVSKDKFSAKETELSGVKEQLKAANEQIQSFKGQQTDLEAINKKVSEWETKYNTDTAALQAKLDAEARNHAEDMFFSGYKFTSKAARNGVLDDFRKQNFALGEDGSFRGGKEFMDALMKDEDYKGAFVTEGADAGQAGGQNPQGGSQPPRFSGPTPGSTTPTDTNPFQFNFTRLRQPPQK